MKNTQVVILAGGKGTRLGEMTRDTPKPMMMIAGKPFLEWQLNYIKSQGLTNILLLLGYKADKIKEYFGDGKKWGLQIDYSIEKEQMGTGGALLQAKAQLDSEFFLLFGDSFLAADFSEMQKRLEQSNDAVMAIYDNKESTDVPFNVSIDTKFLVDAYYKEGAGLVKPEKPLKFVEAGVYLVRKLILSGVALKFCSFEADLLKASIKIHKVRGWLSPHRFYDIGTPERLSFFERKLSDYFPNAL